MIKLKEGQKVLGEDGNLYEIEKGDLIESKLNEKTDAITQYQVTFSFKNGNVYVDEEVEAIDTKIKGKFLMKVSDFTDGIVELIEDFNK